MYVCFLNEFISVGETPGFGGEIHSGVVMFLQEFPARSHTPVWHNDTLIGWIALP